MIIQEELMNMKDEKYGDFQYKLVPGIARECIIGVRVPEIKKLAKRIVKEGLFDEFAHELPHKYYDENMLHAACLCEIKDYELCIKYIDEFLPYVDNWAVNDTIIPKVFKKNTDKLVKKIPEWIDNEHAYSKRLGIKMIMNFLLEDAFKSEYLEWPAKIISEEYYVNMMIAWFYATALSKRWDETIIYITERRLGDWVHNKTIQKARESFRITDEQKEYLKCLKR